MCDVCITKTQECIYNKLFEFNSFIFNHSITLHAFLPIQIKIKILKYCWKIWFLFLLETDTKRNGTKKKIVHSFVVCFGLGRTSRSSYKTFFSGGIQMNTGTQDVPVGAAVLIRSIKDKAIWMNLYSELNEFIFYIVIQKGSLLTWSITYNKWWLDI